MERREGVSAAFSYVGVVDWADSLIGWANLKNQKKEVLNVTIVFQIFFLKCIAFIKGRFTIVFDGGHTI